MEKVRSSTPDLVQGNIEAIAELFPNVMTESVDDEGNVVRAVDFDQLRQELSDHVVDGPQERYRLDWPGKRAAMLAANAPTRSTLRPILEDSVDFETTRNIFIEGDNLEALKILQESYLGKVKLIYIDPPYNTGNDFIYNDDFAESSAEYLERSGQVDESGTRLIVNTESNGRFHSDWLSMMYPRLKLARNLLRPDGVMLVSIGEAEVANLRSVLAEVFGASNFVGQLVWEKKKKGAFLSGSVTNVKEYVLAVARDKVSFQGMIGEVARDVETYPVIKTTNSRGVRTIRAGIPSKYRESRHFVAAGTRLTSGNMDMVLRSDLEIINGVLAKDIDIESNWIYSQTLLDQYAANGSLYITQDLYFRRIVTEPRTKMLKDLLPLRGEESTGSRFSLGDNLFSDGWGTNEDAFDELHQLFGIQGVMSFPKPTKLVAKLTLSVCRDDQHAIVLDFFAGSATSADALWQLNSADGGQRSFVLVQLPEKVPEDSEAAKAGFKTISEVARRRIELVGERMRAQNHESGHPGQDVGFRVLVVDTSNMVDVLREPNNTDQGDLLASASNVKDDRSEEDLLFQVLVEWGLECSVPIQRVDLDGIRVFDVDSGALIACFAPVVGDESVRKIAEIRPLRAVFRDSGFNSDAQRINVEQIFRELSPDTQVKVI